MRVLSSFVGGVVVAFALAALPCFATQVAVLKNGFSIRHEHHEVVGEVTRLYTSADGSSFVDVPTAQLDHFEAAPALPSSASASRVPTPARSLVTGPKSLPATAARFPSASQPEITAVVQDASGRYQLDPDLVNSVIKAESGFNVRAVSPKGARGLMQLMPGTASQLGVPNAFDARANVDGGTKYLRELLERYNFDLVKALAAYNAGPQRVERFGGVPPYYETRAYVARIVRDFNNKKIAQQKAAKKNAAQSTAANTTAKSSVAATKSASGKTIQAKANPTKN
jgi:soluble lytic murein transglycosylase-like protein